MRSLPCQAFWLRKHNLVDILEALYKNRQWCVKTRLPVSMKDLLSKNDVSLLLEMIHSSLSCVTEEDLINLTNHLKSLFPYEFAVCALFRTEASIDENHFIN